MAKHRVSVHHLPSGKEFVSDADEFTDDEFKDMKELLKHAAAGKANYITFKRMGTFIVIPGKILQESVLKVEPVESIS